MIEIVAFTGFTIMVVLFLSSRYHNAKEELQPRWWYGVAGLAGLRALEFDSNSRALVLVTEGSVA